MSYHDMPSEIVCKEILPYARNAAGAYFVCKMWSKALAELLRALNGPAWSRYMFRGAALRLGVYTGEWVHHASAYPYLHFGDLSRSSANGGKLEPCRIALHDGGRVVSSGAITLDLDDGTVVEDLRTSGLQLSNEDDFAAAPVALPLLPAAPPPAAPPSEDGEPLELYLEDKWEEQRRDDSIPIEPPREPQSISLLKGPTKTEDLVSGSTAPLSYAETLVQLLLTDDLAEALCKQGVGLDDLDDSFSVLMPWAQSARGASDAGLESARLHAEGLQASWQQTRAEWAAARSDTRPVPEEASVALANEDIHELLNACIASSYFDEDGEADHWWRPRIDS
jgi:hypothetical protein